MKTSQNKKLKKVKTLHKLKRNKGGLLSCYDVLCVNAASTKGKNAKPLPGQAACMNIPYKNSTAYCHFFLHLFTKKEALTTD